MKWHNREILRFKNSHNCSINDPMLVQKDHSIVNVIQHFTKPLNILLHGTPDKTMRVTERSIELPLAMDFIQNAIQNEPFIELGCVLPYYFFKSKNHTVYDLSDTHYDNIKKDIRELSDNDFAGNIIAISTVEHINLCEYGIKQTSTSSPDVVEKIISNAKNYFITFPLGYNKLLDDYVHDNHNHSTFTFITRRQDDKNDWETIPYSTLRPEQKEFGTYCYANTICVLTNYTN